MLKTGQRENAREGGQRAISRLGKKEKVYKDRVLQ